jgi:hypothetical protein
MSAQRFIKDLKAYLVDVNFNGVDEKKIISLFNKWQQTNEITIIKDRVIEKEVIVYLDTNGLPVGRNNKKPIDEEMDLIINDICRRFSCPVEDALSNTRKRKATNPRYFIFNIMRELGYSYPEIAKKFGKDHSTVMHGKRQGECYIKTKAEPYYSIWKEYKK